jgi:hypothetical protein
MRGESCLKYLGTGILSAFLLVLTNVVEEVKKKEKRESLGSIGTLRNKSR